MDELKDFQEICKAMEQKPKMTNADVVALKDKITAARNKITN